MNIRDDGTLEYECFVDELYKFYEIVKKNEDNANWEIKKFHVSFFFEKMIFFLF